MLEKSFPLNTSMGGSVKSLACCSPLPKRMNCRHQKQLLVPSQSVNWQPSEQAHALYNSFWRKQGISPEVPIAFWQEHIPFDFHRAVAI